MAKEIKTTRTKKTSSTPAKVSKSKVEKEELFDIDESSTKSKNSVNFLNKIKGSKATYVTIALALLAVLAFLLSKWIVVAWVDNMPITRVEYYKALEAQNGSGVLEEMIVERLVQNEAVKKNAQVTNEELETEIARIEKEQGGKENLMQSLQMYGYSQDKFRKLVKLQLVRQKLFGQDAQISDAEVNKFLEDNKNQYENPTDKDRQEIMDQLKQQKLNATFSAWVKENLSGSRVKKTN